MYHLLVLNSIKTTRSIYSCIFYFVGIASTEESLELSFFFLLLFSLQQQIVGNYQNFTNLCLLCYLMMIDEVSTGQFLCC